MHVVEATSSLYNHQSLTNVVVMVKGLIRLLGIQFRAKTSTLSAAMVKGLFMRLVA